MKLIGLVGHPVSHSLSAVMHNAMFWIKDLPYRYLLIDVEGSELGSIIEGMKGLGFKGFNVTIPHKEEVARILRSKLSEEAEVIGAVNTVVESDGDWTGYNTDVDGILRALESCGASKAKRALLLGAGGSARAAIYALARTGVNIIYLANRTLSKARRLSEELGGPLGTEITAIELGDSPRYASLVDVVMNCTSIGMNPLSDESPLLSSHLMEGQAVIDLVYSPLGTKLIGEASKAGCKVADGVVVLVHQGAKAFKLWTGEDADTAFMERVVRNRLRVLAKNRKNKG